MGDRCAQAGLMPKLEISPTAVYGILNAVGQSCECDLDRSWMQGPRVPLRWNAAAKERVVQDLSFDAESPFVKTEISGILARGPQHTRGEAGVTLEEAPLAYEEIVIPTRDLTEDPLATTSAAPVGPAGPWAPVAPSEPGQPEFWWLGTVLGCAIAVGFGTFIAIRSSRRGGAK